MEDRLKNDIPSCCCRRYDDFFAVKSASQKKIYQRSGKSHDLDMDDSDDVKTAGQKKKSEQFSEPHDLNVDDVPNNHNDDQVLSISSPCPYLISVVVSNLALLILFFCRRHEFFQRMKKSKRSCNLR